MSQRPERRGLAVLVGAGPGEPSLITQAGLRWLSRADVVLYDRLAGRKLLDACRADAELIYVGKGPEAHAASQAEINALLVAKCRQGRLVVRLKGGDPFIFGRGGEEADALREAGLPYRIVPGVTAGIAAGAFAGIPLTDRRLASTVAFITGHEDPAKDESAIDYSALARIDTLVFYMGVGNLAGIAGQLIAAGRGGETPVAVVANAARPNQRTVTATLATIARRVQEEGIRPPAVLIVGEVTRLRDRLAWLEELPLFGQTVLVTRTRQQASQLSEQLAELGAAVIEAPTIEIRPPEPADAAALDAALKRIGEYDWLVLTSPNGATAVIDRLRAMGRDARGLAGVRIAAVGPATADVLRDAFLAPDLIPAKFTTQALAEALAILPAGQRRRLLLARADIATDALANLLRAAGSSVEEVTAYRTVRPAGLPQEALDALRAGRVDWITFTSSSTVDSFFALTEGMGVSMEKVRLASIGPVTTEALARHGLVPTVTAAEHTIDGLVAAMAAHAAARGGKGR